MSKLYEISDELAKINHDLSDSDGVLDNALEQKLDSLNLAFNEKAEGIVKWCRNIDGDELALENEIKRLTDRKTAITHLRDRLENYLKFNMEQTGKDEVDLGLYNIAIVKKPPATEEVDKELTPAHFVTIKTEKVIDRKGILKALKDGETVPGWQLKQGTRLRIK